MGLGLGARQRLPRVVDAPSLFFALPTQEFSPSPEGLGKTVSMGDFVRDILLDQVSLGGVWERHQPLPVGLPRFPADSGCLSRHSGLHRSVRCR